MSSAESWTLILEIRYSRFHLRRGDGRGPVRQEEITAERALELAPLFGEEVADRIRDQVRVNALKARKEAQKSTGWVADAVKRAHEASTTFQARAAEAAALGIDLGEIGEDD